jgi:pimeloyl-ACP methyl ester carboxylesterase
MALIASNRSLRRSIAVNNRQVVYFEYPAQSQKSKTLVMIHGYRGNHRGLEAIAAGLTDFRLIIPDLPGFGESQPLVEDHSVENYSSWLGEFVSTLGLTENLHLMGHSFGTLVVGEFGIRHDVRSICLVNPVSTPALEGPRAGLTNLTKLYYLLAAAAPKTFGEWLLRNKMAVMVMSVVMAKSKDRVLRRWIHNQHLTHFSDFASVKVATEGYRASISTDISKLASQITAPVLIVAASLDDITDIKSQRLVAKSFPNAVLKEIENVGHLVHYEAPDQAANFIVEFLSQIP